MLSVFSQVYQTSQSSHREEGVKGREQDKRDDLAGLCPHGNCKDGEKGCPSSDKDSEVKVHLCYLRLAKDSCSDI